MPERFSIARRAAACGGLAAFLYQFENCLTATALPVMSQQIPHLAGVISLVPAIYLVAALVAMVPAGRLAAQAGHHKVLAGAIAVMALGSLVCWLAPNAIVLFLGRLIQGFGGGSMASAAYGVAAVCVPPEERRGVLGWFSLGAGLGMVMGTPLGGLLAATISWRALFGLQVPLLIAISLVMLRMNFGKSESAPTYLGFARSLLIGLGAGFACVACAIGRESGWLSAKILLLLAASVFFFIVFVWSEQRSARAIFPRDVWASRAFWPCWGLLFAISSALGGLIFLLPFYLHEIAGMSVPAAARWMVIVVACYSFAALNAGRLQKLLATESQALIGSMLALAGITLFAIGIALVAGPVGIAVGCATAGLGFGLAFPAVNSACVARLPEAHRAVGAVLLPLGINLGSMTGTIAAAEVSEALMDDYTQAFFVSVFALAICSAGFWRQSRARLKA